MSRKWDISMYTIIGTSEGWFIGVGENELLGPFATKSDAEQECEDLRDFRIEQEAEQQAERNAGIS